MTTVDRHHPARAFGVALTLTALLSGCFSDDGFGLDPGVDSDGDEAQARPCTDERSCVPHTPAEWMGPVARWTGDPGQAAACPDTLPIEWARFGDVPVAQPVGCECSCASGVACGGVSLELFPFGDCQGTPASPIPLPDSGCEALGNVSGSGARARAQAPASPPTCAPKTRETQRPDPTWQTLTVLCGPTDTEGDCGEQAQCLPRAPAPMQAGSCVFRPGVHTCPTGPWTAREVVYETFEDTRACTACSCGAPDLDSCAPAVELFTDDACTQPHPVSMLTETCAPMQGYAPRSVRRLEGADELQIACEASGGDAVGEVLAADPVTLCCTP